MRLVASLVVRNERNRYLQPCIESLLEFCDEIRVLDDNSDDGTLQWLQKQERVFPIKNVTSTFYRDEGKTRQMLLDYTLALKPTHVLAIDADEFISDGRALREAINQNAIAWTLEMTEVWAANENGLSIRVDRLWGHRRVPVLYRVPEDTSNLRIMDRKLACGREPVAIRQYRHPPRLPIQILHFGWANISEREQRYQRYVEHDGGQFHANSHLASILDGREVLQHQAWPAALGDWKDAILRSTGYDPA